MHMPDSKRKPSPANVKWMEACKCKARSSWHFALDEEDRYLTPVWDRNYIYLFPLCTELNVAKC